MLDSKALKEANKKAWGTVALFLMFALIICVPLIAVCL